MIQRIQSIFLLAIVLLMGLTLYFPIWEKQISEKEKTTITAFHQISYISKPDQQEIHPVKKNNIYIAILVSLIGVVAAISLFSYKKRMRQLLLGAINGLILLVTLGITVYLCFQTDRSIPVSKDPGKYQIGLFLITIAIILNIAANRFIRRDDQLVKSADRMR